jgi:hypothetical protein
MQGGGSDASGRQAACIVQGNAASQGQALEHLKANKQAWKGHFEEWCGTIQGTREVEQAGQEGLNWTRSG